MDIVKGKTKDGRPFIQFLGSYTELCTLFLDGQYLEFRTGAGYSIFSQDQIKGLVPYLQSFAESGTLESQSPLQGVEYLGVVPNLLSPLQGGEDEKDKAERASELAFVLAKRIQALEGDLVQAVEHIKALEQLLIEWKRYELSPHGAMPLDELVSLTEELLEEE